jgi:hypothetical protein
MPTSVQIANAEGGLSIRTKLNTLLDSVYNDGGGAAWLGIGCGSAGAQSADAERFRIGTNFKVLPNGAFSCNGAFTISGGFGGAGEFTYVRASDTVGAYTFEIMNSGFSKIYSDGSFGINYFASNGHTFTGNVFVDGYNMKVRSSSGEYAKIGGVLKKFTADVSHTGAEADLYSYSVPANTLANTGETIEFEFSVADSGAGATGVPKIYFAGTLIYDSTVNSAYISNTNVNIYRGTITRTGAATAKVSVIMVSQFNAGVAVDGAYTELAGLDFTAGNILKLTGSDVGDNIIAKHGQIKWMPNGN